MFDVNSLLRNSEFNYSHILQQRALYQPDKIAFIYLVDGENEKIEVTYKELDNLAKNIAGYLQLNGAQGERVLLLYPSGIDYIAAFFACLYAGAIAVPLYQLRNNRRALSRMHNIFDDAQAKFILSTQEHLEIFENNPDIVSLFNSAFAIATDNLNNSYVDNWTQPIYQKTAYLQYTSGSTGNPKGVMVGHHNLAHNNHITQLAWNNDESSTIVSWLPLHHDMGLIGMILESIYSGSLCVFMSPIHFVKKPLRWLQAISDYQANISGAPNFAYDLCIGDIKPEQLIELDLTSWQIAYNAAEPVRAKTIQRFSRKFAVCGFNSKALYPYYGMAEATLFTTGFSCSESPHFLNLSAIQMEQGIAIETLPSIEHTRIAVSCGHLLDGIEVKIVNYTTMTEVTDETIGEVWISGPSKALGYWNKPQDTKEIFEATLTNDPTTTYLRSGDLGFIKNNELYIVGRLKDIIIIRGKNYYPIDIEFSVENSIKELKNNESAAFSIEINGKEELVVVQTIKHDEMHKVNSINLKQQIHNTIVQDYEINPYDIVLVTPGQIPKTSSGKVQRKLSKELYLKSAFKIVA